MKLCEESVTIASHGLPNDHPHIARCESMLESTHSILSDIVLCFTVDVIRLASCHQCAGRLDDAIHLLQQCTEILRKSLPSTRQDLCAGEYEKYIYWHDVRSSDCSSVTITRLLKELFQAVLDGNL